MARASRRRRPPPEIDLEGSPGLSRNALQKLNRGDYSHVAQAYLANGSPDIAAELVRDLKGWAKQRVLVIP